MQPRHTQEKLGTRSLQSQRHVPWPIKARQMASPRGQGLQKKQPALALCILTALKEIVSLGAGFICYSATAALAWLPE